MVNKKSRVEQTEDGHATVFRSVDSIMNEVDSMSVDSVARE